MIQEAPFFWLVCDHDGCGIKSTEGSDYAAWVDMASALDDAERSDWLITDDNHHYCADHRSEHCSHEWVENVGALPDYCDVCGTDKPAVSA